MKSSCFRICFFVPILFLLVSCQVNSIGKPNYIKPGNPENVYPSPNPQQVYPAILEPAIETTKMVTPEQPENGKASLSGILIRESTKRPLNNLQFYITLAVGNKKEVPPFITVPKIEKGDVIGMSDVQGNISLNNIPPGDYYLIINYVTDWVIAQVSGQDTRPLLISLKGNQRLDLGRISVPDN